MSCEPSRRRWQWGAGLALAAVLVSSAALWLAAAARTRSGIEAGKALFEGTRPMKGRIVGHDADLPPEAVRCTNCHPRQRPPALPDAASALGQTQPNAPPVEAFAKELTRASLTELAPRRGGPASAYNPGLFCRLLQEGIDPAYVVVPQAMPRYTLTREECDGLWAYITAH